MTVARGATVMLAVMVAVSASAPGNVGAQSPPPDDSRDLIEWPTREFPTIQSAIDALRENGRLRIAAGEFEISQPLVIRGNRIIEGAGCTELPRGRSGNTRGTRLVGPRPTRMVAQDEGSGLFTFIARGGGLIKGVALSGFDAGIQIAGGESSESGRSTLEVEDTCIADTTRGISSTHPSMKMVARNVLIRDVLLNGVSIAPGELGSGVLDSILISFGLTVLNPGQACIVLENSSYQGFQQHLQGCGFNGPAGLGVGLFAVNSWVSFVDSTVNAPNGLGIAANGGITGIKSSQVFLPLGVGILLFNPHSAAVENSEVRLSQAFPAGHPLAGNFGDGIDVAGPGSVSIAATAILDSARAGLANFGSSVSIGDTTVECAAFDIEGEAYLGANFAYVDRGGNKCGCPLANATCVAVSASLAPPAHPSIAQ